MKGNKYISSGQRANKIEIGNAVEKIFKVKGYDVRTMNMAARKRMREELSDKKNDWKKAIVTLAEGNTIEMFEKV